MDKKLLSRALLKCKYNKAKLGREIGINSRSFIHQIISGHRPMPEYAEKNLKKFMGIE